MLSWDNMQLRRETAQRIRAFLDEWFPPVLRDARWFMRSLFVIFYGPLANDFLDFKQRAVNMTPQDFAAFYAKIADAPPHRASHLTDASLDRIVREAANATSMLDVGAGKGFLIKKLAAANPTAEAVACDVHIEQTDLSGSNIHAVQAPIEHLPFQDKSFDVVTCTHTLEHVMDLPIALAELRRITARKLVVVVPKQRPYRYTFDPHVQFFPYRISIATSFGTPMGSVVCEEISGDWFYTETRA